MLHGHHQIIKIFFPSDQFAILLYGRWHGFWRPGSEGQGHFWICDFYNAKSWEVYFPQDISSDVKGILHLVWVSGHSPQQFIHVTNSPLATSGCVPKFGCEHYWGSTFCPFYVYSVSQTIGLSLFKTFAQGGLLCSSSCLFSFDSMRYKSSSLCTSEIVDWTHLETFSLLCPTSWCCLWPLTPNCFWIGSLILQETLSGFTWGQGDDFPVCFAASSLLDPLIYFQILRTK